MTRDIQLGAHTLRVVTTYQDYGSGTFRPGVHLFLKGPNGSVNGIGPKAFPLHNRVRRFRSRHPRLWTGWHKRNHSPYYGTLNLYVPVPHLTDRLYYGRRLYRVPGLRYLVQLQYRFFKEVFGR